MNPFVLYYILKNKKNGDSENEGVLNALGFLVGAAASAFYAHPWLVSYDLHIWLVYGLTTVLALAGGVVGILAAIVTGYILGFAVIALVIYAIGAVLWYIVQKLLLE